MRLGVCRLEAFRLYPSVRLGCAYRGMTQKLLDSAEVCAPLEQMRRKGVSKGVRSDSALQRGALDLASQPAAYVACGQPSAALREEQRGVRAHGRGGQRRAAAREVRVECAPGGLAHREDPRLRALALDPDLLGVRIHPGELQVHELLRPK